MSKDIIYNEEARKKVAQGIDKVANAVKVTLGPKGRNVLIKKPWGLPDVTKDGVTVAKEITLTDQFEDVGAQLCKQVALKTNESVGDGTTTATVLAQAMVNAGMKYISTGANAVAIKRGVDLATSEVINYINKNTKHVEFTDDKTIANIASISGNDPVIGDYISDAFTKAGEDGIVTLEEGKGIQTSIEVIKGFQFDRGYTSPMFVTNPDTMECVYENCLILFWDKRITSTNELIPLANLVVPTTDPETNERMSLLIIADDIEGEALSLLVLNKLRGNLPCVAVKSPGFGDRKKNLMSDMALLTGGTFFNEEMGKLLEKVSILELGRAQKVIVTKDSCTIIGGKGSKEKITERIESLKSQLADSDSQFDQEKLTERIAKLSGSASVIRLGAPLESELKEKKYRYEDALNATKVALKHGIIEGGAVTLYRARKVLSKIKSYGEEALGIRIVQEALQEPILTILENAGFDSNQIYKILSYVDKGKGYSGVTGKIVNNMFEEGIIDPANVVKSSLLTASSIAGTFLTTEAVIVDQPQEKKNQSMPEMY